MENTQNYKSTEKKNTKKYFYLQVRMSVKKISQRINSNPHVCLTKAITNYLHITLLPFCGYDRLCPHSTSTLLKFHYFSNQCSVLEAAASDASPETVFLEETCGFEIFNINKNYHSRFFLAKWTNHKRAIVTKPANSFFNLFSIMI